MYTIHRYIYTYTCMCTYTYSYTYTYALGERNKPCSYFVLCEYWFSICLVCILHFRARGFVIRFPWNVLVEGRNCHSCTHIFIYIYIYIYICIFMYADGGGSGQRSKRDTAICIYRHIYEHMCVYMCIMAILYIGLGMVPRLVVKQLVWCLSQTLSRGLPLRPVRF